jgi:hypothetical protein
MTDRHHPGGAMPGKISNCRDHLIAMTLLSLALMGCDQADPPSAPQPPSLPTPPAEGRVELPFGGPASDVLVDDIDGDGRMDLAFTSHGENFTQVFYQRELRRFEAGPRVDAVGFHPGNLTRLPLGNRPTYLMSAEGENKLLTMEPAPDGGLTVVAAARARFPRFAAPFLWPDWGLGVVMAPFSTPSVVLLKNYDPYTVKATKLVDLAIAGTAFPLESITVADLEADGSDEIILPLHQKGTLGVIRYPGPDGQASMEMLWDAPSLGPVRHVVAADFNSDGLADLLAPQQSPKPDGVDQAVINVLLSKTQGGFDLIELPFPAPPRAEGGMPGIRAIDTAIDHDGLRYIFASGYDAFVLYQVAPGADVRAAPVRRMPFLHKEGNFKVVLRDVDGDGWLDAVVARGRDVDAGLVLFGPLWDYFGSMVEGNKPDS